MPADRARLAFPGGATQMIDAWFDWIDKAMLAAFPPERIAAMKIRERIRELVLFRLEALAPHREALRRALAILAMPQNALAGAGLAWRSADRIWRIAGDTATDFNHYSKRAILIGVYGSTSLVFLDDDERGAGRDPRLPRPPDRRRHALREGQGALAGHRRAPALAEPLPRPAALSGRLTRY